MIIFPHYTINTNKKNLWINNLNLRDGVFNAKSIAHYLN